jgi:hypothetical protein
MRSGTSAIALAAVAVLSTAALAAAQQPWATHMQLVGLLSPGDTVWVTDAHGREVKGKVASVTSEAVALKGRGAPVFRASDVRVVRRRAPGRRTWTGAAVGALAGLGAGIAACAAYPKDDPLRGDACMMAVGLSWMPGFGAGALVGAMFPGRRQVVYRAPGIAAPAPARLSIAPVVTPRAKGVAIALSF